MMKPGTEASLSAASHRRHLFVVSAPSGAGKTTICKAIRKQFPDMQYSISYTTRSPRARERDGVDYYFISKSEFERRIRRREWAEWARVHDHFYGTSATMLQEFLKNGLDVLLDIDVQGAEQIRRRFPDCISIFILPPSITALRRRLEIRGTENRAEVEKRLRAAHREMECKDRYSHRIVNDDLETAIKEMAQLIRSYQTQ